MPLAGTAYLAMVRGGFEGTGLALLLSLFLILRDFVSPASLAGLGLAWLMGDRWPTFRRRVAWAGALEVLALAAFGAWFTRLWLHAGGWVTSPAHRELCGWHGRCSSASVSASVRS